MIFLWLTHNKKSSVDGYGINIRHFIADIMLTHIHFAVSVTVVGIYELIFTPERSVESVFFTAVISGFISSLLDLDVLILIYLKSRNNPDLRVFRNPLNIYKKYDRFMELSSSEKFLGITPLTHVLISIFVLLLLHFYLKNIFIPVFLAIFSHLTGDVPEFWRILEKRRMI